MRGFLHQNCCHLGFFPSLCPLPKLFSDRVEIDFDLSAIPAFVIFLIFFCCGGPWPYAMFVGLDLNVFSLVSKSKVLDPLDATNLS